ncbi:MAG: exodeoxyribonuclease III [Burkholderiales bacterium]
MRVISINFNGIRSAANKGFFVWLAKQKADIVCAQEIKAQEGDLTDAIRHPKGFAGHFHCAEKKGYSGVALYSRAQPDSVIAGLSIADIDAEGRYIRADFGNLSVISLYLPSGSSGEERQQIKFAFLQRFYPILKKLKKSGREIILCGDWNIAHKEIDLKNWKANQKNSGFLPEERAWLSEVFDELGYVDVFRTLDQRPEQYTWWSARGQARAKNVGWRIDYQIATPGVAATAKKTTIYTGENFSDHAPLTIDYDYKL